MFVFKSFSEKLITRNNVPQGKYSFNFYKQTKDSSNIIIMYNSTLFRKTFQQNVEYCNTGMSLSCSTNTNPILIQNSILAFHFLNFSIQHESFLNSRKYFITLVSMAFVWECKSNLDILECKKCVELQNYSICRARREHIW